MKECLWKNLLKHSFVRFGKAWDDPGFGLPLSLSAVQPQDDAGVGGHNNQPETNKILVVMVVMVIMMIMMQEASLIENLWFKSCSIDSDSDDNDAPSLIRLYFEDYHAPRRPDCIFPIARDWSELDQVVTLVTLAGEKDKKKSRKPQWNFLVELLYRHGGAKPPNIDWLFFSQCFQCFHNELILCCPIGIDWSA